MPLRVAGEEAGMRIAICDDEEISWTYLRELLVRDSFTRGTDIQVAEYADGQALLRALEAGAERLDVVFLDIRMPGTDWRRPGSCGRGGGETSGWQHMIYESILAPALTNDSFNHPGCFQPVQHFACRGRGQTADLYNI